MKSNKLTRALVILLILALDVGCDQLSKIIVRRNMGGLNRLDYLGGHFTFQRVQNTGAFLSLGDSLSGPVKYILLNILPLIAILFGLYYIFTKTDISRTTFVAVILIIGGGLGNLYDRIHSGSVTDFMHIGFGVLQTGIFNVADMSIMAGTIMILLHAWFKKAPADEKETGNKTQKDN